VVGQGHNQAPTIGDAQDWKHVYMMSKGTFIRSVANSYSCKWFVKKFINKDMTYFKSFSKGGRGLENNKNPGQYNLNILKCQLKRKNVDFNMCHLIKKKE